MYTRCGKSCGRDLVNEHEVKLELKQTCLDMCLFFILNECKRNSRDQRFVGTGPSHSSHPER